MRARRERLEERHSHLFFTKTFCISCNIHLTFRLPCYESLYPWAYQMSGTQNYLLDLHSAAVPVCGNVHGYQEHPKTTAPSHTEYRAAAQLLAAVKK